MKKEDIVYLLQRFQSESHSGIQYQATVMLKCFANTPEFAGELSPNKKEAQGNAASQALQAYQEEIRQEGLEPNTMTRDADTRASEKDNQPVLEPMGEIEVRWNAVDAWRVSWCKEKLQKARLFYVRQFMNTGKTYDTAKADALRAATALRRRLLKESGITKTKREESPVASEGGKMQSRARSAGVIDGTSLVAKRGAAVFESPESWKSTHSIPAGHIVVAAGPPRTVQGYLMVPIVPSGAVELTLFREMSANDEPDIPSEGDSESALKNFDRRMDTKPRSVTTSADEHHSCSGRKSRRKLEEEFYTVEQSEDPDLSYPTEHKRRKIVPRIRGSVGLAIRRYSQNVYLQ